MYYSINLENGLIYTINPKYYDFLDEEEIIDLPEIKEVSFKELINRIKERIINYIVNNQFINDILLALKAVPTIPEVLSYTIIKIL